MSEIGVRPTKSRGQNFLTQTTIADRIVAAAELSSGDEVIEIGPGLGILSERIAASPIARLTLIELEARLASRLQETFAGDRRIRIVNCDFLDADFAALVEGRVKVIGNLPFSSAAAILARLCDHHTRIARMVLMFQREVGERIRARARNPSYGALSVFTSLYFEVESHFRVSAGNFHPRPKVDAEVLAMRPRAPLQFGAEEEAEVLRTVRASFSAPRKTLRNALSHGMRLAARDAETCLRQAKIDPAARAETLATEDFVRLARALRPMLAEGDA